MQEELLMDLKRLVRELKEKEAAKTYILPEEVILAVKRVKHLEGFLYDILHIVSGSGGIRLGSLLRREFGIRAELADHMGQWARYSKERFEDELHDAIDRAEIRAGKQELFFTGSAGKKESSEALQLLQGIAHTAIRIQLNSERMHAEAYLELLELLLRYYELPFTMPKGDVIGYRGLLAADRLLAMAGGQEDIAEELRAFARQWYQSSPFTFFEEKESYLSYEYVVPYLYLLTEEQMDRLRAGYIEYVQDEVRKLKAKPELHRAEHLLSMLEAVLSWEVPFSQDR
ncbi:hypothetical protein RAC89_00970 [Paenibacillus sp. GD4]|uniref:hypothetical protein n=1 Tax=Paenibacillus sp. GD4 TaxID=3068890 RepID=UPI0027967C04|nr:hypothetical protein [Paenibacillus sp. GD4]MDQ1909071.1 hypothetical protein [Paenibacillus sp. GD4]